MDIDKWVAGCRVRTFGWIDGKNIYMNIQYYDGSGTSLGGPPAKEKSVLIPKEEEQKVREYLHSIVTCLMDL